MTHTGEGTAEAGLGDVLEIKHRRRNGRNAPSLNLRVTLNTKLIQMLGLGIYFRYFGVGCLLGVVPVRYLELLAQPPVAYPGSSERTPYYATILLWIRNYSFRVTNEDIVEMNEDLIFFREIPNCATLCITVTHGKGT